MSYTQRKLRKDNAEVASTCQFVILQSTRSEGGKVTPGTQAAWEVLGREVLNVG